MPIPHNSDERKQGLDLRSNTKPSGSERDEADEEGAGDEVEGLVLVLVATGEESVGEVEDSGVAVLLPLLECDMDQRQRNGTAMKAKRGSRKERTAERLRLKRDGQ